MNKWNKLRRLGGSERWRLLQAAILLPFTALCTRAFGFNRCYSILKHHVPLESTIDSSKNASVNEHARVLTRIVNIAAAHGPFRANCLQRSLVLWWLLRREKIGGDLRIGVRKNKHLIEAHAWVEFNGRCINDSQDAVQSFVPFNQAIVPSEVEFN